GLLSALGLRHAVLERFAERQVLEPLERVAGRLGEMMDRLAAQAAALVESEGVPKDRIEVRRRAAHLRFAGQDSVVEVPYAEGMALEQAFEDRYTALFGHRPEGRPIEVESIRAIASSRLPAEDERRPAPAAVKAVAAGSRRAYFGGATVDAPYFDRSALPRGARLDGPALV